MVDPRKVQGSNRDVAEGGLDVEASFAELDEATAHRLAMEAQAQAERQSGAGAGDAAAGEGAAPGRDAYGV